MLSVLQDILLLLLLLSSYNNQYYVSSNMLLYWFLDINVRKFLFTAWVWIDLMKIYLYLDVMCRPTLAAALLASAIAAAASDAAAAADGVLATRFPATVKDPGGY